MPGLSRSMWNLVPLPGIEPWPPALGTQHLSHWTIRDIPEAGIQTGINSQFTQKISQTCIMSGANTHVEKSDAGEEGGLWWGWGRSS